MIRNFINSRGGVLKSIVQWNCGYRRTDPVHGTATLILIEIWIHAWMLLPMARSTPAAVIGQICWPITALHPTHPLKNQRWWSILSCRHQLIFKANLKVHLFSSAPFIVRQSSLVTHHTVFLLRPDLFLFYFVSTLSVLLISGPSTFVKRALCVCQWQSRGLLWQPPLQRL